MYQREEEEASCNCESGAQIWKYPSPLQIVVSFKVNGPHLYPSSSARSLLFLILARGQCCHLVAEQEIVSLLPIIILSGTNLRT